MNPGDLTHLIYASTATTALTPVDLEAILLKARVKNAARSISGVLLYTAGSFFQVLEGHELALAKLFPHIAADPRHKNVTKIIHEPIVGRAFGSWSMGYYSAVDPSQLESIEGFSDFFAEGNSLVDLRPGRAKKLLTAFAQGRWRARIDGSQQ